MAFVFSEDKMNLGRNFDNKTFFPDRYSTKG
jgi:hypothetical protein